MRLHPPRSTLPDTRVPSPTLVRSKPQSRKNIIQALHDIDWGAKTMSVRINGLDTHYMYRDVVEVIEGAGDRLDLVMVPKVGTAADIYAVDMLQIGRAHV